MQRVRTLLEDAGEAAAFDAIVRPGRPQIEVLDELQALRPDQPDHIPTLQRLGALYRSHGTPGLARQAYEHIREMVAEARRSHHGHGTRLPIGSNRVHLAVHEALYDLADCHARTAGAGETEADRAERGKAADTLLELIELDPDDVLKAHRRIGSELLRAGRRSDALEWIARHRDRWPPYHYEQALDAFVNGPRSEAGLALRRGMLANGYIAEQLWTGRRPPGLPLADRAGSDIDTADTYVGRYGGRWNANKDALAWVRWYWEHPSMLEARAAYGRLRAAWSEGNDDTRQRAERAMARMLDDQERAAEEVESGCDPDKPPWRPADPALGER